MTPDRHLVLVGPTASGKSAVALELARLLAPAVELVTADSMQVYRGMDIGTAKPSPADRAEVPHHLLDVADPDEDFSVARFQREVRAVLHAIEARSHVAVLVGGTGLYVQAVVDGLDIPGQWPDVKAALEAEPDTAALLARLQRADPAAAARIEPGNRRRVVRALEVTVGSGRPFSSFGPGLDAYGDTPFVLAGLRLDRPVLDGRIERRFRAMVDAGFVDEVRALAPTLGRTARQALGYREVLGHVEDGEPLEACIDEAVRRTRRFARRQEKWFRRDPRITWFEAEDNPLAVAQRVLGDWQERCRTPPTL